MVLVSEKVVGLVRRIRFEPNTLLVTNDMNLPLLQGGK